MHHRLPLNKHGVHACVSAFDSHKQELLLQDLHHRLPDDGHSMRQRHTELIDNTFVPTGLATDAADLLGVNLTTAVQAMPTQPATPAPVAPLETIFVSIAAYR